MTQETGKLEFKLAYRIIAAGVALILMGAHGRLQAQTLAAPCDMPVLYKEIPGYVLARQRARYKINLPQCIIEYRGDGYYLISGEHEFVILNQNPAHLKGLLGKMVAVKGKTTENVVPWHRVYFVAIDEINGIKYQGQVSPWVMREPMDKEIRFWNLHKKLPPATQKFMDYLALPKEQSDFQSADREDCCDPVVYREAAYSVNRSYPATEADRQLTAIQRQLTAIEQKMDKRPYQGIYSTPSADWNSTDWSMYMDLQGGG
ncbi:MAG: hypothetical protein ACOZFS_06435 [Thermodesulfobacteriota bacterium]